MQAEACIYIAGLKFNLYIDGTTNLVAKKLMKWNKNKKWGFTYWLRIWLQAEKVAARGAVSSVAGARRRDAPLDEHVEDGLRSGLAHSHVRRRPKISFSGGEGRGGAGPGWGHAAGDQHKEEEQGQFGAEGRRLDKGGGGGHVMTVATRRKGRKGWMCSAVLCLDI